MRCPHCSDEIPNHAAFCPACDGKLLAGARRRAPAAPFTIKFAGAAFLASALFELFSLGAPVAMFGAMRGGVVAALYHVVYIAMFAGLGVGLWWVRPWGYAMVLAGTCCYTIDNLRFALDRAAVDAQISRLLTGVGRDLRPYVDEAQVSQMMTIATLAFVACWWGFAVYVHVRRDDFRRPATGGS